MRNVFQYSTIVIVAIWLLSIFLVPSIFEPPRSANEFGDMFGAVDALFSGLALAAIFATLSLQQVELGKQANAQESQARFMAKTARIQALGALLGSYTQQIGSAPGTLSGDEHKRVLSIRKEIEALLSEPEI